MLVCGIVRVELFWKFKQGLENVWCCWKKLKMSGKTEFKVIKDFFFYKTAVI